MQRSIVIDVLNLRSFAMVLLLLQDLQNLASSPVFL